MIFTKPINEITFDDVVEVLAKKIPENKQLDYKYLLPENAEKFAKTIASFANALGGTIIVGVKDDKDDKPARPFTGIPYQEKLRNKIEDIIQYHIDPLVFVEINVCRKGKKMFVVINIPQSNLTPHVVGKTKKVFVRTGQSSRPEAIVHPDHLPWLLDHRRKAVSMRHILSDKAKMHFDNSLKALGKKAESTKGMFSMLLMPMYPEDHLIDYRELKDILKGLDTGGNITTIQDGAAATGMVPPVVFEINSYGLVFYKTVLPKDGKINFEDIQQQLRLFFRAAIEYHKKLLYGGDLACRLLFQHMQGLDAFYKEKTSLILEDHIRMDRIYNINALTESENEITDDLLERIEWALGLSEPENK